MTFDGPQDEFGLSKVLEIVAEIPEMLVESTKAAVLMSNPQTLIQVLSLHDKKNKPNPDMGNSSSQNSHFTRKLYMKVDKSHTEEVLKEYLKCFGQIDSLKLKRHKPSSKSRNFGYVSFKSPLAATAALGQPFHLVAGYPIRLEPPKPYEPHQGSKDNGQGSKQDDSQEESSPAERQTDDDLSGFRQLASLGHYSFENTTREPFSSAGRLTKDCKLRDSTQNLETEVFSETWFVVDAGSDSKQGWRQPRISKLISDRHLREADQLLIFNTLKLPQGYRAQSAVRVADYRISN